MKLPKIVMRYNPKLRKHTKHKIMLVKRRTASPLSQGSKYRARKRGKARGTGNLGRYSKPAVTKFKRTGAKNTKKFDLRFECQETKKQFVQSSGMRAKRLELI